MPGLCDVRVTSYHGHHFVCVVFVCVFVFIFCAVIDAIDENPVLLLSHVLIRFGTRSSKVTRSRHLNQPIKMFYMAPMVVFCHTPPAGGATSDTP